MKTIITNLQVGTAPDITARYPDKLHELHREAGYVREESRFFLRLLNQSKHYSGQQKQQEICKLAKNFNDFLANDQTNMEQMLQSELDPARLPEDRLATNVNHHWKTFKDKFRKLKDNAMTVIGDFFVVRFQ